MIFWECCKNCKHFRVDWTDTKMCDVLKEQDKYCTIKHPFIMGGSKLCGHYKPKNNKIEFKYPTVEPPTPPTSESNIQSSNKSNNPLDYPYYPSYPGPPYTSDKNVKPPDNIKFIDNAMKHTEWIMYDDFDSMINHPDYTTESDITYAYPPEWMINNFIETEENKNFNNKKEN